MVRARGASQGPRQYRATTLRLIILRLRGSMVAFGRSEA